MELYRLIYKSDKTSLFKTTDIECILSKSSEFNSKMNITGILLHSKSGFLQYLEGNKLNVENLFAKIEKDPRHENVVLLGCEKIEERIFPEWEMAYRDSETQMIEYNSDLHPRSLKALKGLIYGYERKNNDFELVDNFFRQVG